MQTSIRDDFDRIALASPELEQPNHNNRLHGLIEGLFPVKRSWALEIGCGTGALAELLGRHFGGVIGVDFSHEMVARTTKRLAGLPNVTVVDADILDWKAPGHGFDLIVSIATFHHLPFTDMLQRCRRWLRPGGLLAIVDICKPSSVGDFVMAAASLPANLLNRALLGRYRNGNVELREAWAQHGHNDRYQKLGVIRTQARTELPGARVESLLYWRYLLTWQKREEQT